MGLSGAIRQKEQRDIMQELRRQEVCRVAYWQVEMIERHREGPGALHVTLPYYKPPVTEGLLSRWQADALQLMACLPKVTTR